MQRPILFALPLLAVLSLLGVVCNGAASDRGPTAFDAARAEAAERGQEALGNHAQRRLWAGASGRLELSCGGPSPDGRLFSLVDWLTGDLAVYDVDADSVRRITDKGSWNDDGSWNECSLFSPDGRRIAFNYGETRGMESGYRYQLRVLDLDNPIASQKVLFELPPNGGWIRPLDWRDDEILTFAVAPGGPRRLLAVNAQNGSARTILESDEGPCLPAKLSPDGTTIAYQGGDGIRLVGRDGGNDRSAGVGAGRLIGWSPSGDLLHHQPERREILSSAWRDGRPVGEPSVVRRELTSAFPLAVAGDSLYYEVVVEAPRVHTATIDWEAVRMSAPAPLTSAIDGRSTYPAWSPDGRTLAYFHTPLGSRAPRIVLRSAQGNEVRELVEVEPANAAKLSWSPDGRTLWFQANGEVTPAIYRVDLESGEVEKAFEGLGRDFAVAPDGTLFLHRPPSLGVEPGLWAFAPATGALRRVVADDSPSEHRNMGVSPDGLQIAYSSFDSRERVHRLWVADLREGRPRELLAVPAPGYITPVANTMVWSPDGRWLLIRRDSDAEETPSTLELVPVDGGPPRVLMEGAAPRHLRLHPDGRRLAMTSGRQKSELWVMRLQPAQEGERPRPRG